VVNSTSLHQTETNWNNPKLSEKYLNMLSIKLLRFVFCLCRFNRNIKTRCFGIELETTETNCFKTNQNKPKQSETTRNNTQFYEKLPIYALYQTVLVGLLFVLVQFKHRNSLFRYRSETSETNILFWIVQKLVLVPVSVVLNRN
jgi:hypothetical protein